MYSPNHSRKINLVEAFSGISNDLARVSAHSLQLYDIGPDKHARFEMRNIHLILVEYQSAFRQPHKLFINLEPVVVVILVISHDLCRSDYFLSVTCGDSVTCLKLRFPWQGIPPKLQDLDQGQKCSMTTSFSRRG